MEDMKMKIFYLIALFLIWFGNKTKKEFEANK
jgi:hypothetical protein